MRAQVHEVLHFICIYIVYLHVIMFVYNYKHFIL